jgi:threonine synthase
MSYLSHLECSACRREYPASQVQTYCRECSAPLLARYDLQAARSRLDRELFSSRPAGMWRWRELLPVHDPAHIVSLGEGDAPLLTLERQAARLGLQNLLVKEEGKNPTGTFKARGLAAAVSKAKELGLGRLIIPTAGNAGGALAAYAARGGLQAVVVMPADTPRVNILECQAAGVETVLVEGLISDAGRLAGERAEREGWFDVSTFKEPYRVEGKKIMGYELAEGFGRELPDAILYPAGGGTGLVGMWKAFGELAELGWLEGEAGRGRRPRLVAVQAAGCAPVVRAIETGAGGVEFWEGAGTVASGLRVPSPFAGKLILEAIRESGGTALAVTDAELLAAQRRLAREEGIFAAPEGAATLAALEKLVESGWVQAEERIVLFNTGTGLKYF